MNGFQFGSTKILKLPRPVDDSILIMNHCRESTRAVVRGIPGGWIGQSLPLWHVWKDKL